MDPTVDGGDCAPPKRSNAPTSTVIQRPFELE